MQFVRYGLLLAAILGLVGSLGYIVYTPPTEPPAYATLVANDLHGEEMKFDSVAGEILIVDFWATWCGPCITEIPHYNAIHEDYGDKGVSLIGLTVESGTAEEVLEAGCLIPLPADSMPAGHAGIAEPISCIISSHAHHMHLSQPDRTQARTATTGLKPDGVTGNIQLVAVAEFERFQVLDHQHTFAG